MPWDECPGENDQGALAERVGADLSRIVKNLSEGESSLGGGGKDGGKSLPGRGNSHCEHQRPCARAQEDKELRTRALAK